jgi:hypothetical protein
MQRGNQPRREEHGEKKMPHPLVHPRSIAVVMLLGPIALGQGTPTKVIPQDVGASDHLLGPGGGSESDGAVHLFELQQNGLWEPAGILAPTDVEYQDAFGWDVCIATFVIGGAPFDELVEGGNYI